MADIQDKIFDKYQINIGKVNIIKLYGLDVNNPNISIEELKKKIDDKHKNWQNTVENSNLESAKKKAEDNLKQALVYQEILLDDKLRKELFRFYGATSGADGASNNSVEFAREYFKLVATTKKIRSTDVDFFFKYYTAEKKNKKAILEMLEKEFKIVGLGKKVKDQEDDESGETKKKENNTLTKNLFEENTVVKIKAAIDKFEEAQQNEEVCKKYPEIKDGIYYFLKLDAYQNGLEDGTLQLNKAIKEQKDIVYNLKQEKGENYGALLDFFNKMSELLDYKMTDTSGQGVQPKYKDIWDNIPEFLLMLRFPKLTPYMFAFVEMKPATLNKIVAISKNEGYFRDETDFLLNYYKIIADNFGITDGGIAGIVRKAEKKAKQNKVLNAIDKKLGRTSKKNSFGVEMVHFMCYWPTFLTYIVFEFAKKIFDVLHYLTIPAFIGLFVLENIWFPKLGEDSILVLGKVFHHDEWLAYLESIFSDVSSTGLGNFVLSLLVFVIILAIYILPAFFGAFFLKEFSMEAKKNFDWIGIERTLKDILRKLKEKTEAQYEMKQKRFVRSKIPAILMNTFCLAVVIAAFILIPKFL